MSGIYKRPVLENMNFKNVQSGKYRGIAFELVQWKCGQENDLESNYYLLVSEKQADKSNVEKLFCHDTYSYNERVLGYKVPNLFYMLDSWHGGITFYDILAGKDGMPRIAKAGCDYNHFWDFESDYHPTMQDLLFDACNTIDELWENAPWLLVLCNNCGAFTAPQNDWNGIDRVTCENCKNKSEVQNANEGENHE